MSEDSDHHRGVKNALVKIIWQNQGLFWWSVLSKSISAPSTFYLEGLRSQLCHGPGPGNKRWPRFGKDNLPGSGAFNHKMRMKQPPKDKMVSSEQFIWVVQWLGFWKQAVLILIIISQSLDRRQLLTAWPTGDWGPSTFKNIRNHTKKASQERFIESVLKVIFSCSSWYISWKKIFVKFNCVTLANPTHTSLASHPHIKSKRFSHRTWTSVCLLQG